MDYAIGSAIQFGTSILNNLSAKHREQQARSENYYYNELAARNADKRTRALYNDFQSPEAQIRQLKEAGLSPALFYDGAGVGQGISTGAQGAGVTGISPTIFGIDPLAGAQMELMQAQAHKAEAEADNLSEQKKLTIAETAKTWAQVGEVEASEALMKAEKYLTRVQTTTALRKQEYEITECAHNAEKAFWEASNSKLTWEFAQESYNKRLDAIAEQVKLTIQSRYKEEAEVDVMNKQKAYLEEQIAYLKTQAHVAELNAEEYGEYVDAYAKNLPQQIELRKQELDVEKWRIGVGAFTDLIRTAGYLAGATQLGDGGYMVEESDETKTFNKNGKQTGSQTHTHNAKKTKIPRMPRIR